MQNLLSHKVTFVTLSMLAIAIAILIIMPFTTYAYVYSGQKWSGTTVSVEVSSWPGGWISELAGGMSSWNAASSPFTFNSGASGHEFRTAALGGGQPLAVTARTPLTGNPITDMDTTFNTSYTWSTTGSPTAYDVESAAAHELGHWLRLLHSSDTDATMYATMPVGETKKRTLETDDLNGINFIY
jgi:hypothetical protein